MMHLHEISDSIKADAGYSEYTLGQLVFYTTATEYRDLL